MALKWVQGQIPSSYWGTSRDLRLVPVVPNCKGSKSMSDGSGLAFPQGLEYGGQVFGVTTIAVRLEHPSQNCSKGGELLKTLLSTRTHIRFDLWFCTGQRWKSCSDQEIPVKSPCPAAYWNGLYRFGELDPFHLKVKFLELSRVTESETLSRDVGNRCRSRAKEVNFWSG